MMKTSLFRPLVAASALAFCVGAATGEEIAVGIADFEQPDAAADWSWYWGKGATASVSTAPSDDAGGGRVGLFDYVFSERGANFTMICATPLPPNPTFLRLRLCGDGSGHGVSLRIIDRTGETFLYPLHPAIDWTGWRQIAVPAASPAQTWSGNKDGVIDPPARIALQMNAASAGKGALRLDDIEVGSWLDAATRIEMKSGAPLFGNIAFGPQQTLRVPFTVRDRGGAAASLVLDYEVRNATGAPVGAGMASASLRAGASEGTTVVVPIDTRGRYAHYEITARIRDAASSNTLQTATTTAAVVPAPPLVPAGRNPFGMNLSLAMRHAPRDRRAGAVQARRSGVGWTREEFSWEAIEPVRGTFNWERHDDAVTIAREEGLGVLGLIAYSAGWARRDPGKHASPPRDVEAYAAFVERVVSRYRGRVRHWEIWNEPDSPVFWPPKPDPAEYAALLKAAYAAAKRADPDCVVMTAGLLVGMNHWLQWDYLDALYTHGAGRAFDRVAWHAYCDPKSPIDGRYESLTATLFERMSAKGDAGKRAWLTEQGWSTAPGSRRSVSEPDQGAYAVQGHVFALSNPSVETYFWFLFRDGANRETDHEQSYGILHPDGSPKPAYGLYVAMTTRLAGKRPAPPVELPGTAICRVFADGQETVFVLWDSGEGFVKLPAGLDRVGATLYDTRGNVVKMESDWTPGPDVRYLVVPTSRAAALRAALASGN
ncbi:MAG: endo-1,4-beta-xylanase [Kiritimatiellia bacterium]|jgi:hypothetical protein